MAPKRVPPIAPEGAFELKATKITGKNVTFDKATFDGFVNFVSRLGIGANNQFGEGHWTFGPFLSRNRSELEAMYRSNWIAGQVIDTVAEDMTRAGAGIVSSNTPEDIDAIERDVERLKIWGALCSTIKWSRLFGGAIAVLLIDGQDLSTPLRVASVGRNAFKGLLVLDRWLLWPSYTDLITDYGPDLGKPKYYDIIGDAAALPNAKVHYSRCVRLDGIELPYYQRMFENGWGLSVLERMHDRLVAFDSATQGAAQLIFKAHLRGVGIKGLRQALSMGGRDEAAVIKQFEYIRMMQSNEGLTLLDSEDEFWTSTYSFSGLAEMMLHFGEQISGCSEIPLVRLFGQSPAGLNSTGESDLRNYYDGINRRQENQLRSGLEKVYGVQSMSTLGKPLPPDFAFSFNPLWQMTDKDKSDVAKVDADAVNGLYNSGLISRRMALEELRQTSIVTGRFTNIKDEDVAAASNEVREEGEMSFGKIDFGETKEDGKKKPSLDTEWDEGDHPRDEGGKFSDKAGGPSGSKIQRQADAAMRNPEIDIPNLQEPYWTEEDVIRKGTSYYHEQLMGKKVHCPALEEDVIFDKLGLEYLQAKSEAEQARRFNLLPKAMGVIAHSIYIDPEDIRREGKNHYRYGLVGRFKDGTVVRVVVDEQEKEGKKFLSIFDIEDLKGAKLARKVTR